ncbi:hypothetical protein [Noviherbaspirillum sp. UKPF54]|uniref:hypothetical protein n=1 Tax=Noviherbaspirillum sp. UKPF54 TaxID=2601898 RepID=UPI0011B17C0F|nr:hypothetical protein [Noviherbaspirillum sp. UKPF54]QDZ26848.1 hypothetical protein FAY22_02025 [Noviherbaspirillum sp. UKPF54]
MAIRKLLITISTFALLGCATPQEMLGWAKDVPFTLTEADKSEFATSGPLFSKGIEQVTFSAAKVCLGCGDFSDTNGIGMDHLTGRIKRDYPALLREQLVQSPLFSSAVRSLIMRATLMALDQKSSVGADAERKHPMSSGAVLTTKVSIQYELLDGGQTVGSWLVTTSAQSNSIVASTRLTENIDGALKRNLRALLLRIVADNSPPDSARASKALAALHSEVDSKRIALGYLAYGTSKVVSTTASVAGATLTAVAQNSGAIADGLNATAGRLEASNRAYNNSYTQALVAGRPQTSASSPASRSDSQNNAAAPASSSLVAASSTTPVAGAQAAPSSKSPQPATSSPAKATQLASADKAPASAREAERLAEQKRKEQETLQIEEKRRKDLQEKAQQEEKRKQQLAQEKAGRQKKEEQEKAENRLKEGCFVPPRYPVQCVVVDKTRMHKDEFTVTYRNNCEGRVYAGFCNMQKDGGADCGADGIRQGGTMSWHTYNATGAYAYKYTGSRKMDYDWVCADENHDPEFHRQNLKRELGAK